MAMSLNTLHDVRKVFFHTSKVMKPTNCKNKNYSQGYHQ